jgi:hypothetical protein
MLKSGVSSDMNLQNASYCETTIHQELSEWVALVDGKGFRSMNKLQISFSPMALTGSKSCSRVASVTDPSLKINCYGIMRLEMIQIL